MLVQPEFHIILLLCTFFGAGAASLVSIRRNVPLGQSIVAVITAAFFSCAIAFAVFAMEWHWASGPGLSLLLGSFIYGIMAGVDANEKKIPNIDLSGVLSKINTSGLFKTKPKPTDPPPNPEEKP